MAGGRGRGESEGEVVIRKLNFLFCENEHGTGDVCFPDVSRIDAYDIVEGNTVREVRKAAKQEGWGRVNGGDFCPGCMATME